MKRFLALMGALVLLTTIPALQGCRPNANGGTSATTPATTAANPDTESGTGIPVIGHGNEVKLEDHLVAGKTTVFDFYSEKCPACMMLKPELEKLAAKRADLALVEIDVNRPEVTEHIDWDSPVAKQHKLESLPYLVIFDADGQQIASGDEARSRVSQWIGE